MTTPLIESRKRITLATGTLTPTKGRRYACTLIAAGPLDGHNLTIAPQVLQEAAPLFANQAAFVNHAPFFSGQPLERLLGTFTASAYDETDQAITANLDLWDTPAADWTQKILDQVIQAQDAEQPAANIGLSADMWIHIGERPEGSSSRPIEKILSVESVDVVFRPASDGARFSRILAQVGPLPPAATQERDMPEKQPVPVAAAPAAPPPTTPAIVAPPTIAHAETLQALNTALLDIRLTASQLPEPFKAAVRTRFHGQQITPTLIDTEIATQKALHASLVEGNVVQGFGQPLDASNLTDPLDTAKNAVHWLFGAPGAKPPPPSLRSASAIYQGLTGDHDWHGSFHADRVQFARASTSTLANLATDAMNLIIAEQWEALVAYRWFEDLVTVAPHDGTLHDMNWVGFGGLANLPVVAEGGTYGEINVADSKETDSFVKYGGYVGITEEMFRMNKMMKIQAIPRALAQAAVRTRSYYISYIFSQESGTGPTLDDDSTVLFDSATHANYATTALSTAAWATARIELYEQTQLGSSKPLGIFPKYLLVPIELYDKALEMFGYGQGPGGKPYTADNTTNLYAIGRPGDPRPLVVPVPDWTDDNNWYYLADKNIQPVIFMSYAQAGGGAQHPLPELFTVTSPNAGLIFTNDVLPIKVRDWFAYGVSGYRGVGGRVVA